MLRIGRAQAAISPTNLFRHGSMLQRLVLVNVDWLLERDASRRGNWTFGMDEKGPLRRLLPSFGALDVKDSRISYRGVGRAADIEIQSLRVAQSGQGIEVRGEGHYNGIPLFLTGMGGSFAELRDTGRPYPMRYTLSASRTNWSFDGAAGQPFLFRDVEGDTRLAGPDLRELGAIADIPLPPSPDYEVSGRLERRERLWRITDATGRFAADFFRGGLTVELPQGEPVKVELELSFQQLRPQWVWDRLTAMSEADLGGAAGRAPELRLTARVNTGRLVVSGYPLGAASARVSMRDGRAVVDPLRLEVAGGTVEGRVSTRRTAAGRRSSADMTFRRLELSPLAAAAGVDSALLSGRLGGKSELHAAGGALADMLASLDGNLAVYLDHGTIGRALMSRLGTDLGSLLSEGGPEQADIVCLAGEMIIERGLGSIRGFILQTREATVGGRGQVDFLERTLNLTLQGESHGISLFDLDAPIRVQGPWHDPRVGVETSGLVAQGGLAALLGVIATPLAALIPMIGLGDGQASPCIREGR